MSTLASRVGPVALAVIAGFLALPALAGVPQRLAAGCGRWIAIGALFEVLSAAGFVVAFSLSFGSGSARRASCRMGLRVLALATVVPGGALLGPALGARITDGRRGRVATRALAFILLTNMPDAVALAAVGVALRMHLLSGPRSAGLTLVPAALAAVLLIGVASLPFWLRARPERPRHTLGRRLARAGDGLREGVTAAQALLDPRDWRLVGPLAYYAFDNAVLWAAFRAFGHSPPLGVIAMAYVIGQLGSLLPVPGGIGGAEAGLIGTLVLYGTAAGPATAAVLVYRAITLAVPLALGAGASVRRRRPTPASGPSPIAAPAGRIYDAPSSYGV
ncbi:MAG: flippase-like protein [Solirubrobacterales bacterium]|nr:flippase-like protein [Solirubrobacterales bacterium]